MKIFLLLCLYGVSCSVVHGYDDVDDSVDVDSVLNDPEQEKAYVKCFLDEGPCTDIALHFKNHIVEGVSNFCAECTPHQKWISLRFVKTLIFKYPDDFLKLRIKYDPSGAIFNQFIQEYIIDADKEE